MNSDNYPLARQDNIVIQELENELLIYDLQKNKAYCLNQTSAMVWELCDGNNSVSDIRRQMSKKLRAEVPNELVWLTLDSLQRGNLLKTTEAVEIGFDSFTRREIIKKIGLSSMLALPIISSLSAPKAVHAQSSGCGPSPPAQPVGCSCTGASGCISNCCGSDSPNGPGICVFQGLELPFSACRVNCECINNCCGFDFTCAIPNSVGTGGNCRVDCECANGDCLGGICN